MHSHILNKSRARENPTLSAWIIFGVAAITCHLSWFMANFESCPYFCRSLRGQQFTPIQWHDTNPNDFEAIYQRRLCQFSIGSTWYFPIFQRKSTFKAKRTSTTAPTSNAAFKIILKWKNHLWHCRIWRNSAFNRGRHFAYQCRIVFGKPKAQFCST